MGGTCAAHINSYSSGGSNSGFSNNRHGSYWFKGNSGFGGFGFANGNNGASAYDSSRSYGPLIHVGGHQNSGYGSNRGSSGFVGGSSFNAVDNGFNSGYGGNSGSSGFGGSGFIAADNDFNSGYGGSSGGSSGRIISIGGGSGNSRNHY